MAQSEVDVAATELEHVDSVVPTLFEREGPFFQWIDAAEDVEISARDARVPLEIWPGGNFGHYDPDGGALGLGAAPKYDKAVINSQHLRMGTQYTRKAEWATESGRKAVVNSVRRLSASAIAEFRRYIDSLLMTAGQGVLGTVSAVSNAAGFDTVTLGTDGFGAKLLRYSQEVAYYTSDLSAARDTTHTNNRTITYHDTVGKQIKSATTALLAATDKVVIGGLGTVVGTAVVSLLGVPYHHSNASSGLWLGLDREFLPQIRANGINANSGAIALSYVRRAVNVIGDRVGMDNMKNQVAWMHPCQVQAIENLGWGLTTIQKSAREEGLNLFFNVDQLGGIPIKKSFSWDKTRIDFTVKGVWKKVVFKQPGLYKKGSETLFDIRSTTDGSPKTSLVFYYVISTNTYINNPPLCSYIHALAVPTGY